MKKKCISKVKSNSEDEDFVFPKYQNRKEAAITCAYVPSRSHPSVRNPESKVCYKEESSDSEPEQEVSKPKIKRRNYRTKEEIHADEDYVAPRRTMAIVNKAKAVAKIWTPKKQLKGKNANRTPRKPNLLPARETSARKRKVVNYEENENEDIEEQEEAEEQQKADDQLDSETPTAINCLESEDEAPSDPDDEDYMKAVRRKYRKKKS